jgi:hypothetical protein
MTSTLHRHQEMTPAQRRAELERLIAHAEDRACAGLHAYDRLIAVYRAELAALEAPKASRS